VIATIVAAAAVQPLAQPTPAPVEVMVPGTFHMGSPRRDVVNARIDHVTTPDKQRQLAAVATSLAHFHAAWYGRSAAIFAKLTRVARPGALIVPLYGAGHAYRPRHFVSATPGYRLVNPEDYLPD